MTADEVMACLDALIFSTASVVIVARVWDMFRKTAR